MDAPVADDRGRRLLSTAEVAERLGVKVTTVYAYVSRDVLHPRTVEGRRGSFFDPADVEAVARRGRFTPSGPGLRIETRVTDLRDGVVRYRGRDAVTLSRDHRYETVAWWLWTGQWDEREPAPTRADLLERARRAVGVLPEGAWPIEQLRVAAAVAAGDPLRLDARASAVPQAAEELVALMVDALPVLGDAAPDGAPVARRLWSALTTRRAYADEITVLDAALVLLADHERAGSTFAARIAASFGADPTSVVGAGLGPMAGTRHGAASVDVEELLADAGRVGVDRALGDWLRQHDRLPGFGHPVHEGGDPRAAELLDRLRALGPDDVQHDAEAILARAGARRLPAPNIDFALGVMVRRFRMRPAAGEGVFAVARTAGWLAHAREEYESPSDLRPRALYVGP